MSSATVELDKQFTTEAGDSHGTISVRVVVLKPRPKPKSNDDAKDEEEESEAPALDSDFDEDAPGAESLSKTTPLAAYLEKQAHGKWCVVFLVNGQRHHAWDKLFIAKDLGFKYLSDRTIIIVDLDGLSSQAMANIIQGSRQGLFEGKEYFAIKERIIHTLKSDHDLKRLQVLAEQKVLEMEAGDEAVKSKLDQLIEGFHTAAPADGEGEGAAGTQAANGPNFSDGVNSQGVVVMGKPTVGEDATLPVLVTDPRIAAVRMQTGQEKIVTITALPREEWANVEDLRVRIVSEVEGLSAEVSRAADHASVTIGFHVAEDFDDDEYPIQGDLQVFARFMDCPETRMLNLPVVVTKKKTIDPVPIELLDEPTYLKVKSRQPVKLIPGGPAVHVKLQWNGKESLIRGNNPRWKFGARCLTLGTFPKIGFGSTGNGRLELILYPPHGLIPNNDLQFEVFADGPGEKKLQAAFKATVIAPPAPSQSGPRKIVAQTLETAGQRRPPYELRYVHEKDWEDPGLPCWENDWTAEDAGCFKEPTPTQPLILVVNQDMGLLKRWRDEMVKKNVAPSRMKERVNHYTSLIAFHLWQMYGEFRRRTEAPTSEEDTPSPTNETQRAEINRVGTTIMKVMEVSR